LFSTPLYYTTLTTLASTLSPIFAPATLPHLDIQF
jgi:hypothetical protein